MRPFYRNALLALGLLIGAVLGFRAYILHVDNTPVDISAYEGTHPKLDPPAPESLPATGLVPTVGWAVGEAPVAAPELAVNPFATGLAHPRDILTLPNGDVLVAETNGPPSRGEGGIVGWIQHLFYGRVGADAPSPDTIVLLRDTTGAGHADQRFVLRHAGLHSPSGMAYDGDDRRGKLYIANHDAVLAWDYRLGDTALVGEPVKIADLPAGGQHWMRGLIASPDGKTLFVSVGSASNIGEHGAAAEARRAGILQIDLTHPGYPRQYAAGMRNPNAMAWNPSTGEMWTVVNERDQIGPNLPPDYLTNVPIGAHYGWPWVYWKDVLDNRVDLPIPDYLTDYTRKPEYALGPHVAPLGLVFQTGGARLGGAYANGAFVARHGSWNRRQPVGYDVVFVAFDARGNPRGLPRPVLSGFLTGHGTTHGRPVWLGWAKDGALLVSDDTGGVIWRVIAPGAKPAAAPSRVVTADLPVPKNLHPPSEEEIGSFGSTSQIQQTP